MSNTKIGSLTNVNNPVGTLPVVNGGTGQTTYTDGQLLIGDSSTNGLDKATLSAGTGITITNGHGSITIASSGGTAPQYSYVAQSSTLNPAAISTWYVLSGASFTVTLPDATTSGYQGKSIILQHGGTSLTQVYTLNTTSAQTIGGIASGSYALYTNGESLTLLSDGSNWQIQDHKTNTAWSANTATLWSATSAFVFTIPSSSITAGTTYTNNGQTFIVTTTTATSTTLTCYGTGAPQASGTLTFVSGSPSGNLAFSAVTTTGNPSKPSVTVSDNIRWRRIGNSAEIWVQFNYTSATGGTTGSGDYLLQLPLTWDSSVTFNTTIIGNAGVSHNSADMYSAGMATEGAAQSYSSNIIPYSTNWARVYMTTTIGVICSTSNFNFTLSSGWQLSAKFLMPVANWQP